MKEKKRKKKDIWVHGRPIVLGMIPMFDNGLRAKETVWFGFFLKLTVGKS